MPKAHKKNLTGSGLLWSSAMVFSFTQRWLDCICGFPFWRTSASFPTGGDKLVNLDLLYLISLVARPLSDLSPLDPMAIKDPSDYF